MGCFSSFVGPSSKVTLTVSNGSPETSVQRFSLHCAPAERRLIFEDRLKVVVQLLTTWNYD